MTRKKVTHSQANAVMQIQPFAPGQVIERKASSKAQDQSCKTFYNRTMDNCRLNNVAMVEWDNLHLAESDDLKQSVGYYAKYLFDHFQVICYDHHIIHRLLGGQRLPRQNSTSAA